MKKSELKEMIRQAYLDENQSIPPHLYMSNPDGNMDSPERMINRYLGNLGVDTQNPLSSNNRYYVEGVRNIKAMMADGRYEEADQYAGEIADKISMLPTLEESIKGMADDGSIDTELEDALGNLVVSQDQAIDVIEYIAQKFEIGIEFLGEPINEAKEDEEEEEEEVEGEEDIDVEDIEDVEGEIGEEEFEDTPQPTGITGAEKEVQDSLESALEAAKELGDEKLINQIGNSITFFTRSHVVGKGEEALEEEFDPNDSVEYREPNLEGTIDSLSRMITPVDDVEGLLQYLGDNPEELPLGVDQDFFYDNFEEIKDRLLQTSIEESYEKKKWLKIAGIKK